MNSILNKGLVMFGRVIVTPNGRLKDAPVTDLASSRSISDKRVCDISRACQIVISAFACFFLVNLAVLQPALAEPTKLLEHDQIQRLEGSSLSLNGVGIRNFLFFDFYEIALFLPQKLSDANAALKNDVPRRVRITLLREVVAERDLEFLMAGLKENNTPEELATIQIPLDQFKSMIRAMGKVAKGSVVQMDYVPNMGTQIWLNRRLLGTVPGAAFNRSVLKIWLGERPIQKNLKRALLGGAP